MSEVDQALTSYNNEITHNYNRAFTKADAALVSLGKIYNPEHKWSFMVSSAPEVQRVLTPTEKALQPFEVELERNRRVYRFKPGELGPVPEVGSLVTGDIYTLSGFLTTEAACSGLSTPSSALRTDGYVEILSPCDVDAIRGEEFIFDGEYKVNCGVCEDSAPPSVLYFSKATPDGKRELDKDGWPIGYKTLPEMITLAS